MPLCRNSSGQQKERARLGLPKLSFHGFPKSGTNRYKTWIVKIRRDPGSKFVINKHTKICSQHFTDADFLPTKRPRLVQTAVPSVFPWTTECFKRHTNTSQIATSEKQRCDFIREKSSTQSSDSDDGRIDENEDGCQEDEDYYYLDDAIDTSAKEIDALQSQVLDLRAQIVQLQQSIAESKRSAQKSLFRLQNIKDDDNLIKFYTGFPDYVTLIAAYKILLESDASVMRQWHGKHCKEDYSASKQGRHSKLPLIEQFFLKL